MPIVSHQSDFLLPVLPVAHSYWPHSHFTLRAWFHNSPAEIKTEIEQISWEFHDFWFCSNSLLLEGGDRPLAHLLSLNISVGKQHSLTTAMECVLSSSECRCWSLMLIINRAQLAHSHQFCDPAASITPQLLCGFSLSFFFPCLYTIFFSLRFLKP